MRTKPILLSLVAVMLAAAVAAACSVPVFRYALERWPAERYLVTVFHKGPLSGDDARIVAWMKACAEDGNVPSNVEVEAVDVDAPGDAETGEVWKRQAGAALPWLVVRYPGMFAREGDVWTGPLTPENARAVLDSPARRDVAGRILSGDALVWVLLDSGDRKADDAADAVLKTEVEKLKTTLELPEILGEDIQQGAPAPKLSVSLSCLRISRGDPAENAFEQMLLKSEAGLPADKPLVFTVFGQGRLLCALVGAGINADNLREIGQFLVGPCSCIVKDQNPGIDLLMSVNWGALPDGRWVKPQEMPPLTSIAELASRADNASTSAPPTAASRATSLLALTAAGAVLLLVVIIVIATVVLRGRRGDPGA